MTVAALWDVDFTVEVVNIMLVDIWRIDDFYGLIRDVVVLIGGYATLIGLFFYVVRGAIFRDDLIDFLEVYFFKKWALHTLIIILKGKISLYFD